MIFGFHFLGRNNPFDDALFINNESGSGASPPESSQKVIVKGRPEFAMCGVLRNGNSMNRNKKRILLVFQALRKS